MMMIDSLTQADIMFTVGPETEVVRATGVFACTVRDYRKEIIRPKSGKGEPEEWIVRGNLVDPVCLKGKIDRAPKKFERIERSPFLPQPEDAYPWESVYGEIKPDGKVVVFLFDGSVNAKVIPTSGGELDLESIARQSVTMQSTDDPAKKFLGVEQFLRKSPAIEGKKAALRMFFGCDVKWDELRRPFEEMLSDTSTPPEIRGYAYGIIAYFIVNERWGDNAVDQVALLCDAYERAKDVKAALNDLYVLRSVLDHCREGERWEERKSMRERLIVSIRKWQPPKGNGSGSASAGLAREFVSLRDEMLSSADRKSE